MARTQQTLVPTQLNLRGSLNAALPQTVAQADDRWSYEPMCSEGTRGDSRHFAGSVAIENLKHTPGGREVRVLC